ncbi:MAG: sigma-70 family RNA polymerase sigma factor [Ferruginibacter sp.]
MNISDEKLLLEGLAREDKESIERIYRENFKMVQSFVVNNSGSADDAADIFQEAMMVLFEKARSGTFELTAQLKTYLFSICRRLWLKKLQSLQRMYTSMEGAEELVAVEEDLETHEKRQAEFEIMDDAMSKIGEPCKSLLEAYYLQKKTNAANSHRFWIYECRQC